MSVELANLSVALMLVFMPREYDSQPWEVKYPQRNICAVKGSSVLIHCSFDYPSGQTVKRVIWFQGESKYEGPSIYDSNNDTSSRYQYIGNKQHNCSLVIQQVEPGDAGLYTFRFETNGNKWSGTQNQPTLRTGDLTIIVSIPNGRKTIKEGDSVSLTCINSCDNAPLTSAVTWFKNGEPTNQGPVLNLTNVTSTHSGNYSCSLRMNWTAAAAVVTIDVEYGPKNTSAMKVESGSNITLTCSSQANPPVENYTWYKVAEGGNISVVGHQPDFFPDVGGQFLCVATNKHGSQNSSVVTVMSKENSGEPGKSRIMSIIFTSIVLVIVAAVIIVRRVRGKRRRFSPTDCEEDEENEEYVNWSVFNNNRPQEEEQPQEATLIYSTANFDTHCPSKRREEVACPPDDTVIYSTVKMCG